MMTPWNSSWERCNENCYLVDFVMTCFRNEEYMSRHPNLWFFPFWFWQSLFVFCKLCFTLWFVHPLISWKTVVINNLCPCLLIQLGGGVFLSIQSEKIESIQCKRGFFLTPNNHWNNEVAVVIVFMGVLRVVFYATAALFSLSPPASVCWGQLWLVAGHRWGKGSHLKSFGGNPSVPVFSLLVNLILTYQRCWIVADYYVMFYFCNII